MNIGVLGGTFNPIHNSHLYIAREYQRQLQLDRVVLVPSYAPPHKPAKNLATADDRLAMCRLAVKNLPLFHVTEFEARRETPSYTYKTLIHIREKYPEAQLYLLMGGDMFLTVQDWRRAEDIFSMAVLCAAQREVGEFGSLAMHKDRLEMMGARCRLIELDAHPMSSTQVREKIQAGEDVSGLLHPDVLHYIRERGLYRK